MCHQRQLILLDPPYDSARTYFTWNIYILWRLYNDRPKATLALWFPHYSDEQTEILLHRVQQLDLGEVAVTKKSTLLVREEGKNTKIQKEHSNPAGTCGHDDFEQTLTTATWFRASGSPAARRPPGRCSHEEALDEASSCSTPCSNGRQGDPQANCTCQN